MKNLNFIIIINDLRYIKESHCKYVCLLYIFLDKNGGRMLWKYMALSFTLFLFFHISPVMSVRINYLIALKAMKMSRRSADASQRSLAYNRIVDALNEFRYIFSSFS